MNPERIFNYFQFRYVQIRTVMLVYIMNHAAATHSLREKTMKNYEKWSDTPNPVTLDTLQKSLEGQLLLVRELREPMDKISWAEETGILMSRREALELLKLVLAEKARI